MSQYAYSVDFNRIVHISELSPDTHRGQECRCFDPNDLDRELIAAMGDIMTWHFRYKTKRDEDKDYNYRNETSAHIAAKRWFVDNQKVLIEGTYAPREHPIEHVCLEKPFVLNKSLKFTPDVSCVLDGKPFLIEIVLHNDIDEVKRQKMVEAGVNVLRAVIKEDYHINPHPLICHFFLISDSFLTTMQYSCEASARKKIENVKAEYKTEMDTLRCDLIEYKQRVKNVILKSQIATIISDKYGRSYQGRCISSLIQDTDTMSTLYKRAASGCNFSFKLTSLIDLAK